MAAADGRSLSARAAIATLPLGVLASGAVEFVPSLPESKRRAFADLVMGPVLKLLLRFSEPFWPAWLANLCCGTGPVTLYWPTLDGGRRAPAVLTAYCTGPRAARLSLLPEDEAVAVVLADLARLFPGVDPAACLLATRRIDWSTDPFARGGYTFTRPGGRGARSRLAAPDTASAVLGRRRHHHIDDRRDGAGGVRERPTCGVGGAELPCGQDRQRPRRLTRRAVRIDSRSRRRHRTRRRLPERPFIPILSFVYVCFRTFRRKRRVDKQQVTVLHPGSKTMVAPTVRGRVTTGHGVGIANADPNRPAVA